MTSWKRFGASSSATRSARVGISPMTVSLTALIAVSMLVTACGKKDEAPSLDAGPKYAPLSVAEKTKFRSSISAIGQVPRAIRIATGHEAESERGTLTDEDRQLAMDLARICQIDYIDTPAQEPERRIFKVTATGTTCPIELLFELKTTATEGVQGAKTTNSKFNYQYKIVDSAWRSRLDLQSLSLGFGIDASQIVDPQAQALNITVSGTGSGSALSTSSGTVTMKMNTEGDARFSSSGISSNMKSIWTMNLNGKLIEFEETSSSDGQTEQKKILLNGEEISKTEYDSYFLQIGFVSQADTDRNGGLASSDHVVRSKFFGHDVISKYISLK